MNYITPKGLEKFKKELEERLELRNQIAKAIKQAKDQGDLSENAEYSQAKAQQGENERRIRWLQSAIKGANVVKKEEGGEIGIGSTVKISNGKGSMKLSIVGTHETDPGANKVSCESPLGKSLLGRSKGEKITVDTPSGSETYSIDEVE